MYERRATSLMSNNEVPRQYKKTRYLVDVKIRGTSSIQKDEIPR